MSKKFYNLHLDSSKRYKVIVGNRGSGRDYFLNQIKSNFKEEQNERKQKRSQERH